MREIDGLVERAVEHGGFISCKDMPDGSQSPYELNINYLDALSNPAEPEPAEVTARRFLAAQAIMLSLKGVPGIYFHSLFGSRGDRASAEATGIQRRINRQKLARAELEQELADASSLRARVFSGFQALLRARRGCGAFHPEGAQELRALDERVFALVRTSPDGRERSFCYHNVSPEPVTVPSEDGRRLQLQPFEVAWMLKGSRLV